VFVSVKDVTWAYKLVRSSMCKMLLERCLRTVLGTHLRSAIVFANVPDITSNTIILPPVIQDVASALNLESYL